jgi:hypothetical protein
MLTSNNDTTEAITRMFEKYGRLTSDTHNNPYSVLRRVALKATVPQLSPWPCPFEWPDSQSWPFWL